jgi:hypothetical protein
VLAPVLTLLLVTAAALLCRAGARNLVAAGEQLDRLRPAVDASSSAGLRAAARELAAELDRG